MKKVLVTGMHKYLFVVLPLDAGPAHFEPFEQSEDVTVKLRLNTACFLLN